MLQLLVTQGDFIDHGRLNNLKYTVERLLSHGIVPIINENDAVSGKRQWLLYCPCFVQYYFING